MSGINTGILTNAYPLSTAQINELESQVLNGGGRSFAYLDENSKLCFALPHGVAAIKDLAWDNAYELTNTEGTLIKKAYKKTGLDTFFLDKTFTKTDLNASWAVISANVFEFDGVLEDHEVYKSVATDPAADLYLVRVSDKFFTREELVGSTFCWSVTPTPNGFIDTVILDEDHIVEIPLDDEGEAMANSVCFGSLVLLLSTPVVFGGLLPKGTYFAYYVSDAAGIEKLYVKSISCLTTADAL